VSAALPLLVALLEVYAAGDIADCGRSAAAESVAARTAGLIPPGATVFVLGDTAYPSATQDALEACYEPTWGRHRNATLAITSQDAPTTSSRTLGRARRRKGSSPAN
jgi:hypothetical protein